MPHLRIFSDLRQHYRHKISQVVFLGHKSKSAFIICFRMFAFRKVKKALWVPYICPSICPGVHSLQPFTHLNQILEWCPQDTGSSRFIRNSLIPIWLQVLLIMSFRARRFDSCLRLHFSACQIFVFRARLQKSTMHTSLLLRAAFILPVLWTTLQQWNKFTPNRKHPLQCDSCTF